MADDKDRRDCLVVADYLIGLNTIYGSAFSRELKKLDADDDYLDRCIEKRTFSSMQSVIGTILNPVSVPILIIIWKESPHISSEAISSSGFAQVFRNGKRLNANSLTEYVCDRQGIPANGREKTRQFIIKLIDAMLVTGLVERVDERRNFKPIQGTLALDKLLLSVLSEVKAAIIKQSAIRRD